MTPGLSRRLATGSNAMLVTAMVVIIVFMLVGFAEKGRVRWDLSADGGATLERDTELALQLLDAQDATVTITAFTAQARNDEAAVKDQTMRDFLRELDLRSPKLKTQLVDYDRDRITAEKLGIRQYGTVVIEGRGDRVDLIEREVFKRRRTDGGSELDFLGETLMAKAITQVLSDQARTVYFLEGHSERRAEDSGPEGLEELAVLLDAQGWVARGLNLLRDQGAAGAQVPDDADAVMIVGPSAPFTPEEEAALREYLGRGGNLGFFVDPDSYVPGFIEDLGILFPEGVVLDKVAVFPFADRPLLRYRKHLITQDVIEAETQTLVAAAAPIVLTGAPGVSADVLLLTSRTGWIERGSERPPSFTSGEDGEGPVNVVAALTVRRPHPTMGPGRTARVLISGDTNLITDELVREAPGNATFALNAVRWLVGDDERMSYVGRPTVVRRLSLSAEQLGVVRLIVMLLLPLLSLLAGIGVWMSRRGR